MNLSLQAGLVMLAMTLSGFGSSAVEHNRLTPQEKADGWRLLFDGKTTTCWRGMGKKTFPTQGWAVEDGCLKKIARQRGGDIITVDKFRDFEFSWEWKLPPRANNGVKYFIIEERGGIGHEYQLIDDSLVKRNPKGSTASFYEVLPPAPDKPLKPMGEWNHSMIRVRGQRVEHWLNGAKVVEYILGSPEVMAGVARSKFKDVKGFGTKVTGHILLTDHTDEAWFRNIKIRELPES